MAGQLELVQHVDLQRAEAAAEVDLLRGRDALVAEHHHVVVQMGAMEAPEVRRGQRLRSDRARSLPHQARRRTGGSRILEGGSRHGNALLGVLGDPGGNRCKRCTVETQGDIGTTNQIARGMRSPHMAPIRISKGGNFARRAGRWRLGWRARHPPERRKSAMSHESDATRGPTRRRLVLAGLGSAALPLLSRPVARGQCRRGPRNAAHRLPEVLHADDLAQVARDAGEGPRPAEGERAVARVHLGPAAAGIAERQQPRPDRRCGRTRCRRSRWPPARS